MNNSHLVTTERIPKSLRRRPKLVLLLAVRSALVFMPVPRAQAFLFDIVLDPVSLIEHVLQVVSIGEQIDAVVQQVANQDKQLEHLNINVTPNFSSIVAGVEGQLDSSLYSTSTPASQLDTRYPANMSSVAWAQYQ